MPQASNITVKNAALADVLLSNVTGASGNLPAVWLGKTLGVSPSTQLKLQMSASQPSTKVRRTRITLAIPYWATVNGVATVIATEFFEISRTTHDDIPVANRVDNSAYAGNIMLNALIKAAAEEGYAPN